MADNYETIIAAAPATNAELLKAALLRVTSDISARLYKLENPPSEEVDNNGS